LALAGAYSVATKRLTTGVFAQAVAVSVLCQSCSASAVDHQLTCLVRIAILRAVGEVTTLITHPPYGVNLQILTILEGTPLDMAPELRQADTNQLVCAVDAAVAIAVGKDDTAIAPATGAGRSV